MRRLAFALSMVLIVASATWGYHVNYRTAETLGRIDDLRDRIAAEREMIQVFQVEWAHLNAPERLKRLVAAQNAELALFPTQPEQFGEAAAIPYPPAPPLPPSVAALDAETALYGAETVGHSEPVVAGAGE